MPYGVKYSGTEQSLDGATYTVEILKNGYNGAVTAMKLAKPGAVIRWGQQGADIFEPIRPSSAEVLVFEKDNLILNELNNADEEMFRLRIKKGASVYWTGKILTNIFEGSLDQKPSPYRIAAVDGLGRLEETGFTATSRVSIVQCVADILKPIGLDLNIRFASNWFTPEILTSDDPLVRIQVERAALRGDNDEILSDIDVLKILLMRFGLQLHQSDNVWWVVQRELLVASSLTYFEYDKDGTLVTSHATYNPAVAIADAEQYSKRLAGGRRPFKPPYKTTTVRYFPKPDIGSLITNPSFEDWSDGLPTGWTKSQPNLTVEEHSFAFDGSKSCFIGAYYSNTEEYPGGGYLEAQGGVTSGATKQLLISVSARISKNSNNFNFAENPIPRKAYFSVKFGDYWLKRSMNETLAWVHQDQLQGFDDYILFRNSGVSALMGWETDSFVTPTLPQQTGQILVRLYQMIEPEFAPGQESTTAPFNGVLWDNVRVDPVIAGAMEVVVEGVETVSASIVLPNTISREALEFTIGDGPSTLTPSRLTIDATILTGNWKRGAYSGENPTGKSIDALLAEAILVAQKQPLEIHQATYIKRSGAGVGAVIEPHNVLVIGTKRYAFTYLERELLEAHSTGEWVELRFDNFDIITSVEAVTKDDSRRQRGNQVYGDNTRVGSETFSNTIPGAGWEIRRDPDTGRTRLTIDEIVARHFFTAGNLIFKDVQVHGGELMITDTGPAVVKSIQSITVL